MQRLKQIAEQIGQRSNPPVHLWKPDHTGRIDIRIDEAGFWFHEGAPISRTKLVELFASILWFEGGTHYLVTPAEKLQIQVEDVPFIIQQMEHADDAWVAVTNTHEQVIIDEQHPVELRPYRDQLIPYVNVRYDLWARVNRSIYFQWVSHAMEQRLDDDAPLLLTSGDYAFEVAR